MRITNFAYWHLLTFEKRYLNIICKLHVSNHFQMTISPKISQSVELMLVEEAVISPDVISLFNHPSNKVSVKKLYCILLWSYSVIFLSFIDLTMIWLVIPPANELGGGGGLYRNHPVCLSIRLSVHSKLNLDHNFLTKGDRALILHKCIPCGMTFRSIPKLLTSWPWFLTYFWKKLNLGHNF